MDDFVTKEVCNLKHEEVKDVKESLDKFVEKFDKKFSSLSLWLLTLLGAIVLNLLVMVLSLIKGSTK